MTPPELTVSLTEQEARALVEAAQTLGYNLPGLTSAVKKLKLAQAERMIVASNPVLGPVPVRFTVGGPSWADVAEREYRL